MHSTNKAFERYFRYELDDVRDIYGDTQGGPKVGHKKAQGKKAKMLKLKD